MRVIAGSLKGRQFNSPGGHRTHPMSEKMRGAMFGVLGDIVGLTVLDAFAGSGALSFEALSRGAKKALLLDNDKTAQDTIEENITKLGLTDQSRFIKANALSWSAKNNGQTFDLLLIDPPYDRLPFPVIERLARHLAPTGVYVLSWPSQYEHPRLPGLEVVSNKLYGDAQLVFYRHIQ
ncbi:MAG: rRNA (guanine966-N2)-methyltransferase [Patescibacteria group bacterium]|nr:rRNA (guanine966-N2)-methyltransferase [Patescibacteria group bacterium]